VEPNTFSWRQIIYFSTKRQADHRTHPISLTLNTIKRLTPNRHLALILRMS
jgi:hypothetical protein